MKDRGRSVVKRFLSPYSGRTKDALVYRILRRRAYADRMNLENLAAARWYLLTEILFCIFFTIHKFPVFWVERGKERQALRSQSYGFIEQDVGCLRILRQVPIKVSRSRGGSKRLATFAFLLLSSLDVRTLGTVSTSWRKTRAFDGQCLEREARPEISGGNHVLSQTIHHLRWLYFLCVRKNATQSGGDRV